LIGMFAPLPVAHAAGGLFVHKCSGPELCASATPPETPPPEKCELKCELKCEPKCEPKCESKCPEKKCNFQLIPPHKSCLNFPEHVKPPCIVPPCPAPPPPPLPVLCFTMRPCQSAAPAGQAPTK
jgi:hypothetical protein